jgi:putative membrane protein
VTDTADDDGWQRLHPLTPVLRSGRIALLLLFLLGQQGLRRETPVPPALLLVAGVVVAGAFGYVSWRVMRYRLTPTELQVESGVLTRRSRRVPLARLQSVDVVRPLFARALGLAELRLEVAGGGETEAPLSYLSDDDAQRLRVRLLDLAAGRAGQEQRDQPAEAPEQLLVAVPTWPLVASTVLGAPLVVAAAFMPVVVVAAAVGAEAAGAVVLAAVPVLLGVGSFAVRRVLAEYGFTVSDAADGLRLRHGLLETRSATIPRGRVQVVRVREPLLWRRFGWVRVEVDVAGYAAGSGDEQAATTALLPVAPKPLADALVARVLGADPPTAVAPAPTRARLLALLSWPRLRVGLDDRYLVSSSGVLATTTDVVPLAKLQSMRLRDGPWQRRLHLAHLHLDTAGRRLTGTVARHRDAAEARALLSDVAARARLARDVRTPG